MLKRESVGHPHKDVCGVWASLRVAVGNPWLGGRARLVDAGDLPHQKGAEGARETPGYLWRLVHQHLCVLVLRPYLRYFL